MNWYILTKTAKGTIRPKGKIHQAQPLFSKEIPYTVTQWVKYLYSDTLPASLPIPPFKRIRGASVTDWMTSVITNDASPLISQALYNCLASFKLAPHRAYDTHVLHGQEKHPFKVLFQRLQLDIIDYRRSTFCTYEKNPISDQYEYKEAENILSHDDITARNARFGKAIYLKEDVPYDGFLIRPKGVIFLVNERIKNAIEQERFTGLFLIPFSQGEDFTEDLHSKLLRAEMGTNL
ncbi:MAG: hypothetical protein AAFZ63_20710 [Bacteroidota bacterium]